MAAVFIDTGHYVALLNRRNQLHVSAVTVVQALYADDSVVLVTSEAVLVEVLTYQSPRGVAARDAAVDLVERCQRDNRLEVIPNTTALFEAGLDLDSRRPDKTYSMVDCMSMVLCRERGTTEVLTADRDFEQEAFALLLR